MTSVQSGIAYLDRTLGGFQVGDNVVWVAESGTFVNDFVKAFVRTPGEALTDTVIYVNANHAPQSIHRRYAGKEPAGSFVHVDAFTHGKGRGDAIFRDFYAKAESGGSFQSVCVENPSDAESFHRTLSAIEDEHGERVRYVFNSLTGLSELWGGERAVQEFFTHHCPKLYELQTVAYWVLEKEAHSRAFLANLSHITQVVIQLQNRGEGFCEMMFLKAEDRPSSLLHEGLRYRVSDDGVDFPGGAPERSLRVGSRIRELRMERDLSQAELARRLRITPSAMCQIENNQVYPSLPLVLDLSNLLGCPLDRFFPGRTPERTEGRGWSVFKKRDQEAPTGRRAGAWNGVEVRALLPEPILEQGIAPYLVRLEKGAEGNRAFFDHKGPEFGWVVGGLLRIAMPEEEVVLRKGDSIYLGGRHLKRWRVEGNGGCELLWILA